jgi:hypothetical protein
MNYKIDGISAYGSPRRKQEKIKICGRCYEEAGILYEANCNEKPEELMGESIGQYHCPDCGAMVLAGIAHPSLCKRCLDRKHPEFDGVCT